MTAQCLNLIGLVANMAGVAIAFKYGYPQPSHEEGVGLGLELATPLPSGKTVAEHNGEVRAQKQKYLILSRCGLGLMFVGFGLQLAATLMT